MKKKPSFIKSFFLLLTFVMICFGAYFGYECLQLWDKDQEAANIPQAVWESIRGRVDRKIHEIKHPDPYKEVNETAVSEPEVAVEKVPAYNSDFDTEELRTKAQAAKAGAQGLRKVALEFKAEEHCPDLWALAEAEMGAGDKAGGVRNMYEADKHFRKAAEFYLEAEGQARMLVRYRTAKKRFDQAWKEIDADLITTYGGERGEQLMTLVKAGNKPGDDPLAASKKLEQAQKIMFQVHVDARLVRDGRAYQSLFAKAQAAAEKKDWGGCKSFINQALATKNQDIKPVIVFVAGLERPFPLRVPLEKGVELSLQWIPAGSFVQGSDAGEADELPRRTQRIEKGFWMAKTEVTYQQYGALSSSPALKVGDPDKPAVGIDFRGAENWCAALSRKWGLIARLPSEVEWEYACRAGSSGPYSFEAGDSLEKYANFCDRECSYAWKDGSKSDGHEGLAPVGSYQPNAWGLHDMHGNAFEWCSDIYAPYAQVAERGSPLRVVRGGCFQFDAKWCRSAARYRYAEYYAVDYVGFRVIVETK